MRFDLSCRIMLLAPFFIAGFAHGGEDSPTILISGQPGTPLQSATGIPAGNTIRAALPAGLRMSDSGVVSGTPLAESYTEINAGLQKLLISIQSAGAGARAASGSNLLVTSPISASPNPAAPGSEVTFTVAATGSLLSYHWSFGDGSSASSPSAVATHTYAAAGSYQASVAVGNGSSTIISQTTVTIGADVARAATPKAPKVKVPSVKANPFDTMQITAGSPGTPAVFDLANHTYSIGFVFAKGKKSKTGTTPDTVAKIPLIYDDSTGTSLSVMVPPFLKSSWTSGNADTFLVTDGVMSQVPSARTGIGRFLKSASKVSGLVTVSWLRANQNLLSNSRATLANPAVSGFIDPKILTDDDTEVAQLGAMITAYEKVKTAKDKDLDTAAKQSDAFITSMLNAGTKVSDPDYAAACKGLLTAMTAATSYDDGALMAAETTFSNELLHTSGARSTAGSRGFLSTGLKFTLGVLTVTGTTIAVIASAPAVIAGTSTAAVAIGVTTAAVALVAGTTALVAGATGGGSQATATGNVLLTESKQIAKDTAVNYATATLQSGALNAIAGKAKGEIIDAALSLNDAANDLQTVAPLLINKSGVLSGGVIPSGSSYYFKIVGPATDTISGSISGTDGYSVSYSGTGTVISPVIPAGAPGVVDTLTGTDTTTSFTATLGSFKF